MNKNLTPKKVNLICKNFRNKKNKDKRKKLEKKPTRKKMASNSNNLHLLSDLEMIRSNTLASGSRSVYLTPQAKWIAWLISNERNARLSVQQTNARTGNRRRNSAAVPPSTYSLPLIVCPSWQEVFDMKELRRKLKNPDRADPPVDFEAVKADHVMMWVASLRKANGKKPGSSTYNVARSGIFDLFRSYGQHMSLSLSQDLKNDYRGLKRTAALDLQAGGEKVSVGKSPFDFELYRLIAERFLKSGEKQFAFSHLFHVICWNLMCRAGNAVSICWDHLVWENDSLGIFFCHMKNDQTGERPKDPRHVYANPLIPEICPILSLAIYLSINPIAPNSNKLFPGVKQYDRFRLLLSHIMKQPEIAAELVRRGKSPDDYGTHSDRKGGASYTASGSTHCPSIISIHLRAGWVMGGVQDRYIRYESAGDFFVGRTVCGLPSDKPEFATLPPHFDERPSPEIIKTCFHRIPDQALLIGEFCLASLVYHSQWLRDNLPQEHPLFSTALFRNPVLLTSLKPHVSTHILSSPSGMRATGIPPHVSLLLNLTSMENQVREVNTHITSQLVPDVVAGITTILEERAIQSHAVTPSHLESLLTQCLERAGLNEMLDRMNSGGGLGSDHSPSSSSDQGQSGRVERTTFWWGGKPHMLPEGYFVPVLPLLLSWQLYMMPDLEKNLPPLRLVHPSDFSSSTARKRFSTFKTLMMQIESEVKRLNLFIELPDLSQCNQMFDLGSPVLGIPESGKRRLSQIAWSTTSNIQRQQRRRTD